MKWDIEVKYFSPIDISIDAIRTCWDSGTKKDSSYCGKKYVVGDNDKNLLNRIVNQHKHHSTVEHLTILSEVTGNVDEFIKTVQNNKFFTFYKENDTLFCSYNLRSVIDVDMPYNEKLKLLPQDYKFLMEEA